MAFIERDDVIQQISTAALHPTFGDSILPWALEGSPNCLDFHRANGSQHLQSVFPVTIQDQMFMGWLEGERFPQLLDDPFAGGMQSDVDVQDAPAVMTDYEEAIEQTELDGRDGEEIHGGDGFAVIAEKC